MKIRTKGNLHCYSKVLELFLEGVNDRAITYTCTCSFINRDKFFFINTLHVHVHHCCTMPNLYRYKYHVIASWVQFTWWEKSFSRFPNKISVFISWYICIIVLCGFQGILLVHYKCSLVYHWKFTSKNEALKCRHTHNYRQCNFYIIPNVLPNASHSV